MGNTSMHCVGKISRLEKYGIGEIIAEDKGFAFTFDKIIGYRGEALSNLKQFGSKGLRVGVRVNFLLDTDGSRIDRIWPAGQPR